MICNRPTKQGSPGSDGLLLATSLGIALLLLSYARIIGDLNSSAGHVAILKSAISEPIWQTRLGLNIAIFVLALLSLHLAFATLCWSLAILSQRAIPRVRLPRRQWILVWFLANSLWVLVANATRFPHSSLGEPYQWLLLVGAPGITPYAVASAALAATVLATLSLAFWRSPGRIRIRIAGTAAALLALLAATGFNSHGPASAGAVRGMPNVIILGIDSLRIDVSRDHAPAIQNFLQGAVRFDDAITPLARTFPSWVSILTGRYPHTTGAYLNLLPRDSIQIGNTLPQILHDHGYRTFYAIDETRFSNLDSSFGFDRAITPRMGGSDFVLALVADTPLSNLVMNTRLGALLFPHIHANRAAHFTYDPDAFVERLAREVDFTGPMMLAAHLTLPHYPFTWATSEAPTGNDQLARGDYFEAVRRADQQFSDILALLEKRGALENALVIVLSDHGEAIGGKDDLLPHDFPGKTEPDSETQRWGHGSSVFSPNQYRVVLGLRAYGGAATELLTPRHMPEPVSLVDLTPTLLELLDAVSSESFDGVSLVPLLRGVQEISTFSDRLRFTETEYNPPGFTSRHASTSAIAAAVSVYRLDPVTDRLEIRRDKLDQIMFDRQFAALLGDRTLAAAIPDPRRDGTYRFVYLPLTGAGAPEEARRLREALQSHYRIEIEAAAPQ